MKKELIDELFQKFESAKQIQEGIEYWSAREIQPILGYAQWKNFEKVIERAKSACENSGISVQDHFSEFGKMVEIGSGVSREIESIIQTISGQFYQTYQLEFEAK
jgi:DNA-damage-inducible protein D